MSGNVWEWCGDLYIKEYKKVKVYPSGMAFEGTYLFSADIARWKLGGTGKRGVRCRTLITTLENYKVTSMWRFCLVDELKSIK